MYFQYVRQWDYGHNVSTGIIESYCPNYFTLSLIIVYVHMHTYLYYNGSCASKQRQVSANRASMFQTLLIQNDSRVNKS